MEPLETGPAYCRCRTLILGCGNDLFGDDGFGREVARRLEAAGVPDSVCVLDVGTSVRQVLFDVALSATRPRQIVVVDGVDLGRAPGELFEIDPADIPEVKLDDFSMHQLPTSNLLRELAAETGMQVSCLVCQVASIPDSVRPGLSATVERAVDEATRLIARRYFANGPRVLGKERPADV